MSNVYISADQLIGKTPMLKLNNIEKKLELSANIYAKLEYFLSLIHISEPTRH